MDRSRCTVYPLGMRTLTILVLCAASTLSQTALAQSATTDIVVMRRSIAAPRPVTTPVSTDTSCQEPVKGQWISGGAQLKMTSGITTEKMLYDWCVANKAPDFKGMCAWNSQGRFGYMMAGAKPVQNQGTYLYSAVCG